MLLQVFFPLLLVGLVWGSIFPRSLPYNGEHRSDSKTLRAVPHTMDLKQKTPEKPTTVMPVTEKPTTVMPVTEKRNSTQKLPLIQTLEVKAKICGRCGKDAICHKKSRKCRCRKGYRGYPWWRCWKKRKCGKCARKAYCNWRTGKCRCRYGYWGNAKVKCRRKLSSKICGRCGKDAICHKKSRKCRCRKGYRGYPWWRCWKTKRCGKCGIKAYCNWRTGKCRCRYGYWGNAKVKCRRKLSSKICGRCGKDAICHKKSRKCRCRKGYRGYPWWRCWKKRKCGKCGRKAYCNWKTGKCRCRHGYWGNAKEKCRRKLSWFRVYKAIVCERKTYTIRCGRGSVLHVYYAKYGRDNKRTCHSKNIKVTKCSAKGATAVVKKKCNGKRKCTLTSNNSVFGDPCVGTYKFLRVFFRCRRRCSKNAFYKRGRCHCRKGFKWTGRTCRRRNGRGKVRLSKKQKQSKERDIEDIDKDSSEVVKRDAGEGEEFSAPVEKRREIERESFNAENQDQSFIGDDAVDSRHRRLVDNNGEINDLSERELLREVDNDDDGLTEENIRNIREAVEGNVQDTSEVKLVRERRVYCGKFGRERNGRCKCNRGFCFRRGKCRGGGGCHHHKHKGEREISNEE